jgi:hypothetical protein
VAVVRVDDHGFELYDGAGGEVALAESPDGLVSVSEAGVAVVTGIAQGLVRVSVEVTDRGGGLNPQDRAWLDPGPWDDIVEVPVEVPNGGLRVQGVLDAGAGGLPVLSQAGPGSYRLRVHVRGRDGHAGPSPGQGEVGGGPNTAVEEYLIVAWPCDPRPRVIIRATDRVGAAHRAAYVVSHREEFSFPPKSEPWSPAGLPLTVIPIEHRTPVDPGTGPGLVRE